MSPDSPTLALGRQRRTSDRVEIGDGTIHIQGGENVKLTVDMSTELGALIGTPAYMSPEQIRGADVDTQTDIWSLGVLLYEMLACHLPFQGSTKIDLIAAVLISEPSPVRIDNIAGLDKINTVLRKALCKEKKDRYKNAGELMADLQRIKDAVETRSNTLTKRQMLRKRFASKYAIGVVLLITLLIAVMPASRRFLVSKLSTPSRITVPIQLPVTDGLVSYWPADGNADDVVGGNNGELLNGATYRPGIAGQAFSFDGVDELFQAPTNGLPTGASDRTMAMWVKVDDFLTEDDFTKVETFNRYPEEMFGGYGNFGSVDQVYLLGTVDDVLFVTNWGNGLDGLPIKSGIWYFIAATTEANGTSIYLDGKLITKSTDFPIDTPSGTQFYSGRIPGDLGDSRRLKGAVDEITVYDRALSAQEIQALFSAHAAPSGLVSYWPADGNANDVVGGNNGELINGATYRPGVSGQAFSFDGVDELFQAPTNGLPTENSDRTMAMWVKVDDFLTEDDFTKAEPFNLYPQEMFGGYGNFGVNEQAYFLGAQGNSLFVSNWGRGPDGSPLESGKWYYIAATTEANRTSSYLDGKLIQTRYLRIDTPSGTQFYSGRIPGDLGDSRRLKGAVDEIQIYNRALSADEIQTLYLSHKPTNN